MTNKEAIKMQEAIKAGLKETGKDHPYRDALIPLMKESCDMAIEALSSSEIPNSSDTIYRQAAIRWVKTECNPYGKPTLDFESGKKVIKHLEQMPSAQPDWGKPVGKDRPLADCEIIQRLQDIKRQIGGSYAIDRAVEVLEGLQEAQSNTIPVDWIQKYADDWQDMSYAYDNPILGMLEDWRGEQDE